MNSFCKNCKVFYPDLFEHGVVGDDGTISLSSFNSSSGYTTKYSIEPIASDDALLNHWVADFGENSTRELKPGDDFDLPEDVMHTFLNAVYDTPAPEPVPAEEEVATSAQTGDSTAAVPLAILAAASAVVLIARKRCLSK